MKALNRYTSRRHLFGRRGFLGGSGAAVMVSLPVLESLSQHSARAQEQAIPKRLLTLMSGNGMPMDTWTPDDTGPNYTLKETLLDFEPLKSKIGIFSGLGIDEGAHSPGDHGAGVPVTFTCVTPTPTHSETNDQDYSDPGNPFFLGESIDQVAAKQFAEQTRIASLQLGLSEGSSLGDGPFAPVYLKNISWASATEPLSPTTEPQVVFNTIFAGLDPEAAASENERRLRQRLSVLDYAAGERELLLPALGVADRARLDQYFTALREVEDRLVNAQALGTTCDVIPEPTTGLSYAETFTAMSDLAVLALQCDATRVISLHLGCYRNDNHYGFLGAGNNHHSLSHPGSDQDRADYRVVCRWIAEQMASLFLKMDAVPELEGSLLDHSLAVYNSDCGDGNSHDHLHLPVLVAGSAGGNFPTGQHWSYERNTPCGALYVSLLNSLGIDIQTFGEKQSGALTIS